MNKKRLLHLADILDTHHDNGIRFDLRDWYESDADDENDEDWCGTKACAVGLACLDKIFQKEGLELVWGSPGFREAIGWGAVKTFFALEEGEDKYLFYDGAYDEMPVGDSGAREVANRIRQTVSGGFPPKEKLEEISAHFRGGR